MNFNLVLFGDQTADHYPILSKVVLRKGNPQLSAFLEQACAILQHELAILGPEQQKRIPHFSSIADLVERYHASTIRSAPIESAITCLAQFAHFLAQYHEENWHAYASDRSTTRVIGVCTGALTAQAIASCRNLEALVPLAVQVVRIAFRLGAHVSAVASQLECEGRMHDSWSTLVTGTLEQESLLAIESYNSERCLQHSNRLYLSSVSSNAVTISGPPSIRQQFLKASQSLGAFRELPILAPFHAPHLYTAADVEAIIPNDAASAIELYNQIFPVVLASGVSWEGTTLNNIRATISDILRERIQWDQITKVIKDDLASAKPSQCRVVSFGVTPLGSILAESLKVGGCILSSDDHVSYLSSNKVPSPQRVPMSNSKIAIIGMAGRFPDATDHEALWKLLESGLDVHRKVPADRFDADKYCDRTGKGKNMSHTPFGCFIEDPGLFDPRFFNMSPREAAQTDPMQRLALTTAYEAMEMAGFILNRTSSTKSHRVATFYGQTSDDWREINAAQDIDTYFITGGVRAFGPGRINYHFNFSGPSFSIDTACSSSLAAIQLACTALRSGECDTVFAGGMSVLTNPDIFSGLSKGQFLSKTGSCKTYDNNADGYCRGDGVATVILKRLDDAINDKDPILGVIAATATNHSSEAVSITHPHVGAQKFLFSNVMATAGVNVRDVDYVEMHGTGTQAGDGVEMESVSSVFAPSGSRALRRKDQPLYLGSIKSNIGHGEAVSGVCAMIKLLLMLDKNIIPPHCGVKAGSTINKNFPSDLAERNVHIAFEATPFPRKQDPAKKRRVFLNNFSAAGGNTALLIEDGPLPATPQADPRSVKIVTISAKGLGSFKKNIERMIKYLDQEPDVNLSSLAYTTTARRNHYNYRAAIDVSNVSQLKARLELLSLDARAPISSTAPKVAFVFTGQGSHYSAMGRQLYESAAEFRKLIDSAAQVAMIQGFPDFRGIITGTDDVSADTSPVKTQLAIVCLEIAVALLWRTWGITPAVVIGHSLGEYAALHYAGVLSVFDVIGLVGRRAELLVSNCTAGSHGMLAVRGSAQLLESMLDDLDVEVACLNSPQDTVLAGLIEDIEKAEAKLSGNFKCTRLNVPYAFHSSQVDPIVKDIESMAQRTIFQPPRIPIISPLLSRVLTGEDVIDQTYPSRHCRKAVDFTGSLQAAVEQSYINEETKWIEIGPAPVCSNMIKTTLGSGCLTAASLRKNEDAWTTISKSLVSLYEAGVSVSWNEFHRGFENCHNMLRLPTYGFDEKVYWIQYKGDWTLNKGDNPVTTAADTKPTLDSTTVQRISSTSVTRDMITVIGESNLAEPSLRAAVCGHLVNGAGLCPSSLYADMALTLCSFAYKLGYPTAKVADIHMNVCKMETQKPLIVDIHSMTAKPQLLQIEAKLNLLTNRAELTFKSLSADGKPDIDHANCSVSFEDPQQWREEWTRQEYLVRSRIERLKHSASANLIHRGMAYKLFSALVDYDQKYRGMESVILDSGELEAVSQVNFQASSKDGKFFLNPYFIDSVCHLTGFIMNANDAVDSANQVYISHGWGSMRFPEGLEEGKRYSAYVKMQLIPGAGKAVAGDVYVFDGERIVGMAGGVKFQAIPRQLLQTLLKAQTPGAKKPAMASAAIEARPAVHSRSSSRHSRRVSNGGGSRSLQRGSSMPPAVRISPTGTCEKALNLIAEEIGCARNELADPIIFADIGVDSLMSLSILGRFREELELEISSTLFADLTSVGELKNYLNSLSAFADSEPNYQTRGHSPSPSTTSISDSDVPSLVSDSFHRHEMDALYETSDEDDEVEAIEKDLVHIVRSTIATEMGVDLEEINAHTDLSTMGMDSLMSLTILGALREKTGMELSADLLSKNNSVAEIEKSLGLARPPSPSVTRKIFGDTSSQRTSKKSSMSPRHHSQRSSLREVSCASEDVPEHHRIPKVDLSIHPPAKSMLLQGSMRTATRNLFLLPDGSGSATSYVPIPDIDRENLCVYGLNCPFMTTPELWNIGVPAVVQIYMAEIRRRQPEGPYLIGGWSAGGVLCLELARQLVLAGEQIDHMILLDSPCPVNLEALPPSFHQFCDSIGLLGDGKGKTPEWLLPHFACSVKELTKFSEALDAATWPKAKMPNTTVIWARDGLVKTTEDPRPEWDDRERMPNAMQWLCENRAADLLGTNGWERLIPRGRMRCVSTTGNHFTMMRDPIIQDVGRLMREALEE